MNEKFLYKNAEPSTGEQPDTHEARIEQMNALSRRLLLARLRRYGTACIETAQNGESFTDCMCRSMEEAVGNTYDSLDNNDLMKAIIENASLHGEELSAERVSATIDDIYRTEGFEAACDYIVSEAADILNAERARERQDMEEAVVTYNMAPDIPQKVRDALNGVGYGEHASFLEIHVLPAFLVSTKSFGRAALADLGRAAQAILHEMPTVEGVIGESWLVDTTPIQRLGFHVVDGYTDTRERGEARSQMIRRDGTLDKDMLARYEAGEPLPHAVKLAHMPVREFLDRFLPEEDRGKSYTLYKPITERCQELEAAKRESEEHNEDFPALFEKICEATTDPDTALATFKQLQPHHYALLEKVGLVDRLRSLIHRAYNSKDTKQSASEDTLREEIDEGFATFALDLETAMREYVYAREIYTPTVRKSGERKPFTI